MGLFTSSKRLPENRYGYTPPEGATARGWRCTNEDCNHEGEPAPRKWPARCRMCGSAAEPWLNEPWHEESEGHRYRWLIDNEGDEFGIFTEALHGWEFGQALRYYDTARARAVLTNALEWAAQFSARSGRERPDLRGLMFYHAISYNEVILASDLLFAELNGLADYESIDFSRIDDNDQSAMRQKWIGFVDRATTLLGHPEARALPQAPAIDRAARYIGSATQHAMGTTPVKQRWQALMRTKPPA